MLGELMLGFAMHLVNTAIPERLCD